MEDWMGITYVAGIERNKRDKIFDEGKQKEYEDVSGGDISEF
jgi:hypothetical protein